MANSQDYFELCQFEIKNGQLSSLTEQQTRHWRKLFHDYQAMFKTDPKYDDWIIVTDPIDVPQEWVKNMVVIYDSSLTLSGPKIFTYLHNTSYATILSFDLRATYEIPKAKDGALIYMRPCTVAELATIKQCKSQMYFGIKPARERVSVAKP